MNLYIEKWWIGKEFNTYDDELRWSHGQILNGVSNFLCAKMSKINYILDLDSSDSIAFGYSIQFRFLIHVQQAIIIANHLIWGETKQL